MAVNGGDVTYFLNGIEFENYNMKTKQEVLKRSSLQNVSLEDVQEAQKHFQKIYGEMTKFNQAEHFITEERVRFLQNKIVFLADLKKQILNKMQIEE